MALNINTRRVAPVMIDTARGMGVSLTFTWDGSYSLVGKEAILRLHNIRPLVGESAVFAVDTSLVNESLVINGQALSIQIFSDTVGNDSITQYGDLSKLDYDYALDIGEAGVIAGSTDPDFRINGVWRIDPAEGKVGPQDEIPDLVVFDTTEVTITFSGAAPGIPSPGEGDVVGPAGSLTDEPALFAGTTGKTVKGGSDLLLLGSGEIDGSASGIRFTASLLGFYDTAPVAVPDGESPVVALERLGLLNNPAGTDVDITVNTAPFTPSVNSWHFYDASGGTFTITLPAGPADGQWVGLKEVGGVATVLTVDGNGPDLESAITLGNFLSSALIGGAGAFTRWYFDGSVWRIEDSSIVGGFTELWDGTPITPVSSTATPIVWTLDDPSGFGNIYFEWISATSVLRCIQPFRGTITLQANWDAVLGSNQDAGIRFNASFTGSGNLRFFTEVRDSVATPRADTFPKSVDRTGWLTAFIGDEIQYTVQSLAGQSGTTNLVELRLGLDAE